MPSADNNETVCSEEIFEQKEIELDDEEAYTEYEITNYPAFYTLSECARKYDKETGIFEVPDFQRNPVWNDQKKAKLIESFLLGLPVPPVFLYTEKGVSFKIIDGLQRIHTVYSFLKNEFRLVGLNKKSPYVNKKYYELSEDDRNRLENTILQATIIKQTNPIDDSSIYLIFERLNTGGEKLNNMEVRRCIGHGKFLSNLEQLNTNKFWRSILGSDKINNRFLDLELLLRIFALFEGEYSSPMKSYLNDYIEKNKNNEKLDVADKFLEAVSLINKELGDKPFTLKGRKPNYTILDSVIVSVMKNQNIQNLKEKYQNLLNNEHFKVVYEAGQGTMSNKSVKERLQIAEELLR